MYAVLGYPFMSYELKIHIVTQKLNTDVRLP